MTTLRIEQAPATCCVCEGHVDYRFAAVRPEGLSEDLPVVSVCEECRRGFAEWLPNAVRLGTASLVANGVMLVLTGPPGDPRLIGPSDWLGPGLAPIQCPDWRGLVFMATRAHGVTTALRRFLGGEPPPEVKVDVLGWLPADELFHPAYERN